MMSHHLAFDITFYRLVLTNMTKKPFRLVHYENLIQLIPIATHFIAPNIQI